MKINVEGLSLEIFPTKKGKLRAGTIKYKDEIIYGYRRIPRILNLSEGIKNFKNEFAIEEKVDGYNVRVVKIKDKILAFTRKGYYCPYTTERVKEFFNVEKFFKDFPNYILHFEVAGKNNPYIKEHPKGINDIKFFLFDISKKNCNSYLPIKERDEIAKAYKIPKVKVYGIFNGKQVNKIKKICKNKEIEGVVIKSLNNKKIAKYVNFYSCIRDIFYNSYRLFDTSSGLFLRRIFLALTYLKDNKMKKEEAKEIGKAFLNFLNAIDCYKKFKEVKEEYSIKVKNIETANKLIEELEKRGMQIEVKEIKKLKSYWKVIFYKKYDKTKEEIKKFILGKLTYD